MKKQLFILATVAAAFALAPAAHAQGIRLGVKAGANLSNLSGDLTDEDRFQNKVGFHGGVMLNVGLIDDGFLSLQPEVLFSQKGFEFDENRLFGLYNNKGNVTYNYLDVPVLLKIKAGGFYVEAGPQYSYLLKIKDESTRTIAGVITARSESERNIDNINRNELGYAAGLGYQSELGLLIGLRYNGSLTDFAKNNTYYNGELRNARNSVFQASVGFLLPGK
ncbi:PorT family protein [Hymenobacter sp. BT186]|uniref:PorT family protein n=1 Tax=Hymenobacter telluris TaxID=2816474 RepID=A0A939EZ40_9BACT|nr:porin family protein [Hymenobacter telluris]MBO0359839.1 PorT family protein [Hymenobacter telluris]MBW3375866.1 PorT family protein [Hymenobacter norwichensis]